MPRHPSQFSFADCGAPLRYCDDVTKNQVVPGAWGISQSFLNFAEDWFTQINDRDR